MPLSPVLVLIGCASIAFANSITVDENAARSGTVKNLFAGITPTSGDFVFCELGVAAGDSDCVAKAGSTTPDISDVLRFTATDNNKNGAVDLNWVFISDIDLTGGKKDGPADAATFGTIASTAVYVKEPSAFPFPYNPGPADPGWINPPGGSVRANSSETYQITSDCSCRITVTPEPAAAWASLAGLLVLCCLAGIRAYGSSGKPPAHC